MANSLPWWGTRQHPSPRMVIEIAAMKIVFKFNEPSLIKPQRGWDQQFYLHTLSRELNTNNPSNPFWEISFQMSYLPDTYKIQINYQKNYPAEEPAVFLLSHRGSGRHIFKNGRLCLHNHTGSLYGWDPAKSTAATFGLWAVEWIRAWIIQEKTGNWPSTA